MQNQRVDLEAELKKALSESKQSAIVTNTVFAAVLDNVGYKAPGSSIDVLEQILPTEYHINNECIEVNRKEVGALFNSRTCITV